MWTNLQFPGDLVTFTEQILNGKLTFLCSDQNKSNKIQFKNVTFYVKCLE